MLGWFAPPPFDWVRPWVRIYYYDNNKWLSLDLSIYLKGRVTKILGVIAQPPLKILEKEIFKINFFKLHVLKGLYNG